MSYDVHLEADLGGSEPVRVGHLDANYTWNVCPMFVAASGCSPNDWDGKPASEVRETCCQILAAFNADPATYRAMNPANGWGNFEGARNFIQKIADACELAPRATVRVG